MLHKLKAYILMVVVQIAYAAVNVIYKLAIIDGMSMRVVTAYRLLFASLFTIPVALIYDRKKRSKITWKVLFLGFLCGLFGGSFFSNSYLVAMDLTSASFMLAMINLTPAITFIMALSCGLEKLNLKVAEGRAKVIGTIIGISGAMLVTFVKGTEINICSFKINLMHTHHNPSSPHQFRNKLLGVPLAILSCCSYSLWYILQAKLNEEYPNSNSSTAMMNTMGALQATIFTLCVDRDWKQWKLGFNIRLLTAAYSGIVASGIMVVIIAWCIKKRGPLFVSIFSPLQLVLVDIAAYFMLDEKLYLGSVVGAVMIVCGLYVVLWGKAQELKKKKSELVSLENTTRGEFENVEVVSSAPRSQQP
ncbi:WAT1-related protein [Vigna unguiculata]|uniref:WAT1-related protein n=1 Tax=Vigna unguiculata TaxID=3917 RepID=A0A4D6L6B2_VIGUN|nr:WAT1-related protein [Vigna unguiculata]